jgi:uncharacterized protein
MIPGSTRGSRVGFGGPPKLACHSTPCGKKVPAQAHFGKTGHFRQNARRVRFPEIVLVSALIAIQSHAAEVIPPKPDRYFNDSAGVVSKSAALRFNEELAQFERETSDQVVVAVFPKMQSDSDIADYAQRVAQAWSVGEKQQRNGVVLLVFVQDHKISIQVGYGLEGALPDAIAYDIRQNRITPHFRDGDYEGGLAVGIDSIFAAIRREYTGTGKTAQERGPEKNNGTGLLFFIIFIIVLIIISRLMRRLGGYGYSSGRGGPIFFPVGGGGWSSGGGGGGGFSGFSGGGGSFGGGGSSGSW